MTGPLPPSTDAPDDPRAALAEFRARLARLRERVNAPSAQGQGTRGKGQGEEEGRGVLHAPRAHDGAARRTLPPQHSALSTQHSALNTETPALAKPYYLWLEVAESCSFRCQMCFNWKNPNDRVKADALRPWEVQAMLASLQRLRHPERFEVSFTGAEPTSHPHLLDFVRWAHEYGYRTTFPTNAWDLDEDSARRIAASGLTTLMISCDADTAEVHDRIRGMPGSFARIQAALDHMRRHAPQVKVRLHCTLQQDNLELAERMTDWAQRDGRIHALAFQAVTQPFGTYRTKGASRMEEYQDATNWFTNPAYRKLWPRNPEAAGPIVDRLLARREGSKLEMPPHRIEALAHYFRDPADYAASLQCTIGSFGVHVTLTGDVFFCFYMDKLGNVRTDSLYDLWFSERAAAVRRDIAVCDLKCDLLMNCQTDIEPPKRAGAATPAGGVASSKLRVARSGSPDFPSPTQNAPLTTHHSQLATADLDIPHSALRTPHSPQHSALSPQHSALSTQHSALSTQHSALPRPPASCVILVDETCRLRCRMCSNWKLETPPDELQAKDWRRFLRELRALVALPFHVNISGGEPFQQPWLLDVMQAGAELGFEMSVVSNGTLITEARARALAAAGVRNLALSLDGYTATSHDALRGVAGSHAQVLKALDRMARWAPRVPVVIQTILTAHVLPELPDLLAWITQDERVHGWFTMAVTAPHHEPVTPPWYEDPRFADLWPREAALVDRSIDLLSAHVRPRGKVTNPVAQLEAYRNFYHRPERGIAEVGCPLGDRALQVNSRGELRLCMDRAAVGTVRTQPLADLWYGRPAGALREEIAVCTKNCEFLVNCYFEEEYFRVG